MNPLSQLRGMIEKNIADNGDRRVRMSFLAKVIEQFEAQPGVIDSEGKDSASETPGLSEVDEKRFQANIDDWHGQREHSRQWDLENFRQILSLGQTALRNTALINGGAAIALLAFSGNLLQKGGDATAFAASMAIFGAGVFVSVFAMATTYISQLGYGGEKSWHQSAGKVFHIVTAVLALCALLIFVKGIKMGYEGLSEYNSPTTSQSDQETFKKNAPPPTRPAAEPPRPPTRQPTNKPPAQPKKPAN